jgi:hypothetical protein
MVVVERARSVLGVDIQSFDELRRRPLTPTNALLQTRELCLIIRVEARVDTQSVAISHGRVLRSHPGTGKLSPPFASRGPAKPTVETTWLRPERCGTL